MNEQTDQAPGLNLPRPTTNEPGSAMPPVTAISPEPFQGTVTPSASTGTRRQAPIPDLTSSSDASAAQAAPQTDYEGIVADTEWIERAQAIIQQTQADPYAQSREIGRLKAEYIKTRYNKDIKVVED